MESSEGTGEGSGASRTERSEVRRRKRPAGTGRESLEVTELERGPEMAGREHGAAGGESIEMTEGE
jgi:hypothetical protein